MPSLFRRTPNPEITSLTEQVQTLTARLEESAQRTTLVQSRTTALTERSNVLGGGKAYQAQILYDAYLQTPWISAPIDVIVQRITSGGIAIEPIGRGANPKNRDRILDFFSYCNDEDDIVELCQNALTGLFVFGAGMWEIVPVAGVPVEVYLADPVTVQPEMDERGTIIKYVQKLPGMGTPIEIDPANIVRFALRGPRGEVLSPLQKLLTTSVVYQRMMRWTQKFFEHGAKPPGSLQLPPTSNEAMASRQQAWLEENYTGVDNAHSVPVLWGGAEFVFATGSGPVEMDFLNSIKYMREEFLAVLGVPPAMASVTDDGNRLTDVSQSADKTFRNNTVNPRRRLFEEKVTYRIIKQLMGIDDWCFKLKEANYDDDTTLVKLVTEKVAAGIIDRDEAREQLGEAGKLPGGGGKVPSITLSREVVPVSDLTAIHGSQFQAAQQNAMNAGMEPDTKPDDLAQASPRDPLSTGDDHPVAARDAQFQANQDAQGDEDKGTEQKEALADLVRWQRVALRAVVEGKTPRPFESDHIGRVTQFAVTESLKDVTSEDAVREIFDLAFADVRA